MINSGAQLLEGGPVELTRWASCGGGLAATLPHSWVFYPFTQEKLRCVRRWDCFLLLGSRRCRCLLVTILSHIIPRNGDAVATSRPKVHILELYGILIPLEVRKRQKFVWLRSVGVLHTNSCED